MRYTQYVFRPALCNASCMASEYGIYTVVRSLSADRLVCWLGFEQIGMIDIKNCTEDCHADGWQCDYCLQILLTLWFRIDIYNTAVVFDPTGLLIARQALWLLSTLHFIHYQRYHKKHITTPFPVFDVPPVAEIVYFDTRLFHLNTASHLMPWCQLWSAIWCFHLLRHAIPWSSALTPRIEYYPLCVSC